MDETNGKDVQKRKRGLETKERILDASAELFAKDGYDGVPMRAIAQKAGVRESSIYNHFKNKAAILEALFDAFIKKVPEMRPSDDEIDRMLLMMEPEEVFKSILFQMGKSVGGTLSNTAMVINFEKYRNPRAAEMYFKYVVNEPADYYEKLIKKMMARGMVKPVDARMMAAQYNYVSITLAKEYIMAQNGLADIQYVVANTVKTLRFFCGLMANGGAESNEA